MIHIIIPSKQPLRGLFVLILALTVSSDLIAPNLKARQPNAQTQGNRGTRNPRSVAGRPPGGISHKMHRTHSGISKSRGCHLRSQQSAARMSKPTGGRPGAQKTGLQARGTHKFGAPGRATSKIGAATKCPRKSMPSGRGPVRAGTAKIGTGCKGVRRAGNNRKRAARISARAQKQTARKHKAAIKTNKQTPKNKKQPAKTNIQAAKTNKPAAKINKQGAQANVQTARANKQAVQAARNAYAFQDVTVARNVGICCGPNGFAWGFGLGFGFGYFASPWAWGGFWGPYSTFGFGWGPGWYYPNFGFWYSPLWYSWYMPAFGAWYFPYDYAWYYPYAGFYVNLYPEAQPYVIVTNDTAPTLWFSVYEEQDIDGHIIFIQREEPRIIQDGDSAKIELIDRGQNDVVIISQNVDDLGPELTQDQAADLSSIQLNKIQEQKDVGEAPADALRFKDLTPEKKEELMQSAHDMENQATQAKNKLN